MLKTLTSRFGHRGRQVTATPSVVFALPGRRQPPDHRRREVRRVLAEQARERLLEVASRDAPQVEDGQERIEALRPTRPARQDHGREPDLLRLGHVGSVAHLGPLHLQGADPGLDPPHRPVPVSDDPLAPVRKCDAGMLRHEGVRLHPHGYGQHPPRSLARDLRQWIIDRIDLAEWDNGSSLLHGVSLLREVLAVFATATIRRLLTPPSPISPHSSDPSVYIPFAPNPVRRIPPAAVRLRRDVPLLLNLVTISSTTPSAKYSCSGSPLMFVNGRTAMEGLSGSGSGLSEVAVLLADTA